MTAPPRSETLLDRLAWRAAVDPSGEALVFDGRATTYGELWGAIEGFARRLAELGIERGDRVVIAVENGPRFFATFYGALRSGAIAVPVLPQSGPGRLINIARRCGATRVVTSSPTMVQAVSEDPQLGLRVIDPEAASGGAPAAGFPPLEPRDVAYIQYTSGSTGEPKGVQITHANVLANIEQMIAGMEITEREVFVSWLPVHHDMGLVLMTMTPLYLGARLVLLPASLRSLRRWLSEIGERAGTFTAAPDFAYRFALRQVDDPGDYDLSSLRVALNAAEPVRATTLRDFERAFGLENVMVAGYGLAESTVGVSMWPSGTAAKIDRRGVPSVGGGFPGVDLAVLGEAGLVGSNTEGEILVGSAGNTPGYWDDPAATAELIAADGYLRTGDLGYLDAAGDLFVIGRRKNIIIQAGRNIAPGEIEELVDAAPPVRLSAAVGVDRGRSEGEQVYVFVELRDRRPPPVTACRELVIELTRRLRAELGLRPGRLYLVAPRTIPKTHNGKIRHAALKERYLDGRLRAQGMLLFPNY